MICVDKSIKQFIRNADDGNCQDTRIIDGVEANVTSVGYDLCTQQFLYKENMTSAVCELDPGEAIFVESLETVHFAKNVIGRVYLKNGRIRQGLALDAPVYQPGHKTKIFFRLMNVSENRITLSEKQAYAMLVFEQLEDIPDEPYHGTFADEFNFRDLGAYSSAYRAQLQSLDGKLDDIKELEQRMYGNVTTLLTVFIGIFTLLNININLAKDAANAANFVLFNAGTLCAISFLMALINEMLQKKDKNKAHGLWWAPILCAAVAICGYLLLK